MSSISPKSALRLIEGTEVYNELIEVVRRLKEDDGNYFDDHNVYNPKKQMSIANWVLVVRIDNCDGWVLPYHGEFTFSKNPLKVREDGVHLSRSSKGLLVNRSDALELSRCSYLSQVHPVLTGWRECNYLITTDELGELLGL